MKWILILISLILVLIVQSSIINASTKIKEVNWGTQEWSNVAVKDGSGFYNQLFQAIFESQNVTLKTSYMPFKRAIYFIENHTLDFGGAVPNTFKSDKVIKAKYPVLLIPIRVMFRKQSVKTWQGIATLRQSLSGIVATPTMAKTIGLPESEVFVVKDRIQALKMLQTGRKLFYLDGSTEIDFIIQQEKIDRSQYQIEDIGFSKWYMIAPNTSRGRAVIQLYERGTKSIHQSGKLQRLYKKFKFIVPPL